MSGEKTAEVSLGEVLDRAGHLARLAGRWDVFDAVREGVPASRRVKKGDRALDLRRASLSLSQALRRQASVVVLRIRCGFDQEVHLFTAEGAAFSHVCDYVRGRWGRVMEEEMPKDPAEAVKRYFQAMGRFDEEYGIERAPILSGRGSGRKAGGRA